MKTTTLNLISAALFFCASLLLLWLAGAATIAAYHAQSEFRCVCVVFAGFAFMGSLFLLGEMQEQIDEYRA